MSEGDEDRGALSVAVSEDNDVTPAPAADAPRERRKTAAKLHAMKRVREYRSSPKPRPDGDSDGAQTPTAFGPDTAPASHSEQFVLGDGAFQPLFAAADDDEDEAAPAPVDGRDRSSTGTASRPSAPGRRKRRRRTTVTLTTLIKGNKGNVGVLAGAMRRMSKNSVASATAGSSISDAVGSAAEGPGAVVPPPLPEHDEDGGASDPGAVFLLGSTLQLMEDVAARAKAVGHVLPILNDLLDPTKHTFNAKAEPALERLREWMHAQEEERELMKRFQNAVTTGWLRKYDSHKITSRSRWCVLDGGNLMYYEDRAETRLKGVLKLAGASCREVSNFGAGLGLSRGYPFEVVAAEGSTLNPMHTGKSAYRFVAGSDEQRQMWLDAVTSASGNLEAAAPALKWRERLSGSSSGEEYKAVLREMAAAKPLKLGADWVRLQMATADRGMDVGEADEEATARKAARKAAEVSAERRQAGYTPGERVSLSQLDKDVQRDKLDVDGTELQGPEASFLIASLAKRVAAAVKGYGDTTGWVSVGPKDTQNCFQSAVVGFAREVLLCSSRTVTGGDAYDAVELVFRNPDCVHICPDYGGDAEPVEITLSEYEGEAKQELSASRRSHSNRSRSGTDTLNPLEAAGSDSEAGSMSSPDTEKAPRRTRSFGGGSRKGFLSRMASGSVKIARVLTLQSPKPKPVDPPPSPVRTHSTRPSASYKDAATRPGKNVCVTVKAQMRYRLINANPTRNNEPAVGILVAGFSRRFPWRGCPLPAEVTLRVEPVPEEGEEEDTS